MDRERVVAIAGNPNVGKSTVFNNLTNLHQHTGNWPGKTVVNATGYCSTEKFSYKMVDIPGTYSPDYGDYRQCHRMCELAG